MKMNNNTVLLVVDIQKGITDERLYEFDKFVSNVTALIEAARNNNTEVIYVRHDDGENSGFSAGDDAFEIYEAIAPLPGEKIFDKKVNSALHENTGLLTYLENQNVRRLIVTGLQTDFCIDATVKSAFEHGFEVIVPQGCNSTKENRYVDAKTAYEFYNRFMWPGRYAKCLSVEETIEMLKSESGQETDAEDRHSEEGRMSAQGKRSIKACGTESIDTGRLLLRRFEYSDTESMLKNWVADEENQWMYGEPPYPTKEAVKALLDSYIGRYQSGYYYRWAVTLKETGECIGQAAYFLVDAENHFGEIEYCIGKAFQGKGYATEATKALIEYGFDRIGFHKVQICVRPSNKASKKVIEKCAFAFDGVLKDYFYRDGAYEDRLYYSLIAKDGGEKDGVQY